MFVRPRLDIGFLSIKSNIDCWEIVYEVLVLSSVKYKGFFLCGGDDSNPGIFESKNEFCEFPYCGFTFKNPNRDHESIKSLLRTDTVSVNLCPDFWNTGSEHFNGKGSKKVYPPSGLPGKFTRHAVESKRRYLNFLLLGLLSDWGLLEECYTPDSIS